MFDVCKKQSDNSGMATDDEIRDYCFPIDYRKVLSKKGAKNLMDEMLEPIGISVITDGNKAYVTQSDSFYLVLGSTGSYKTRKVVMPYVYNNMLQGNSMFVVDIKGDIYMEMSPLLKENGYTVRVINFNDPDRGDAYNPVKKCYDDYKAGRIGKAIKGLDRIGINIFSAVQSDKDAFWHTVSQQLFVGQMRCIMDNFGLEYATIDNAYKLYNQGNREYKDAFKSTDYIHKLYENNKNDPAWELMQAGLDAPRETKGSIMSVYITGQNSLASQNPELMRMMSRNTFEVDDLVNDKTAVFLIANEESMAVHNGLISLIIQQFYDRLIEISDTTGGALNRCVSFVLDEFGNYQIPDFDIKVSLSRARNINYMIVLQNFAQLNLRYSADVAKTIISNTSNWIFMNSPDYETMKYISNLCGSKVNEYTGREEALMTVNDLRMLQKFCEEDGTTECLLLLSRMKPYIANLPDITAYYGVKGLDEFDIPVREDPVIEPFDFVAYVKNIERDKYGKIAEVMISEEVEKHEVEDDLDSKVVSIDAVKLMNKVISDLNDNGEKKHA